MDILFASRKLEKLCNEDRSARKQLGAENARKLRRRLDDLAAAATLNDLRHLPGRCHELTGDLAGHLALDLQGAMRLIFEPTNEPVPRKADGGLDWLSITRVRLVRIEDYHG